MSMKKLFSAIAISAAMTSPVMAEGAIGSGPNPFSDCGIGAAIFENSNVGAAISNILWDLGTTALTSATASPETCNAKEASAAAFIFESYDNLVVESSHGEGRHFAALMNILHVESDKQDAIMSAVRKNMATTITADGYTASSQVERAQIYYNSVIAAITSAA